MNRRGQTAILALTLVAVLAAAAWLTWSALRTPPARPPIPLAYSDFLNRAEAGAIAQVIIQGTSVRGTLRDHRLFLTRVPEHDTSYINLLYAKGASITVRPPSDGGHWGNLLIDALLLLGLMGGWVWMMRRAQSGLNGIVGLGKVSAQLHTEAQRRITLDDVAGVNEAKEELEEIIEFLRHPKKFQALGAKIPRGVLLVGPPGSGTP